MIKFGIKLVTLLWMLSPFIFVGLRLTGIVNIYHMNWLIGVLLAAVSTFCMFMTFGDKHE